MKGNSVVAKAVACSMALASFTASVTPILAEESDFMTTLEANGYAEYGNYKVEKIKDGVYHMDESTQSNPGGKTDEDGNMNNPSSIYFVESENSVLMVDLGNPATGEAETAAKYIVEEMVGDKPLSIVVTHSHGDHTGLGRSTAIFENVDVEKVYISALDEEAASEALTQFAGKIETLDENDTFTVDGNTYTTTVVNAHTDGSLMIEDLTHEVLFTGDTFGSGFVWLFWDTNNANPIASLKTGVSKAQESVKKMASPTILAGHRWQQFWESNSQRPGEMTIQYFNDMSQVISGLADGTTSSTEYTSYAAVSDGVELSSNGAKAKIDTRQAYVDAYIATLNAMEEAYVYSAASKLGIETVNNTAGAAIVVYPDGYLSDKDAKQFLDDSGITDYCNTHATTVYVARPSDGAAFTSEDVEGFKTIVNKITVCENFKLVGIGNGADFINDNLSQYMNFVSGLALINPSESTKDGSALKASVPTYVSGNVDVASKYITANSAKETSTEGTITEYANPDSKYEIVVTDSATLDPVSAYKEAWDKVLCKFARIGNYKEEAGVGTWYSRPLITGDEEADSSRKYQYFESVDGITNITRTIYTEDLDGDGIDSLWYVYVPEEVKDEEGTVPVVFLMHGNTNDPRTQYDTSGWASIASKEGIILVCPEWQGHTYQGYTYDPMTEDTNFTANSDFITGCYKSVMENYPQIDQSRVYISGLSAGCRNTTNNGLVNTKYFAAGAGQSGPFKNNDASLALLQDGVEANKEGYDFPIIYFSGDRDEYLGDWDVLETSGGLQMVQLYAELNDMDIPDGKDADNQDLYGVDWDETYTIEQTAETVTYIKGGIITNDNNVEISMNRIYGWGHWNYAPDAELMWNFMKKYARDTETGETIRLDLEEDSAYTINASAGENGKISPSGEVEVTEGEDQTFTITPNTGYEIDILKVDGKAVDASTTYTFKEVSEEHTIEVTFKKIEQAKKNDTKKDDTKSPSTGVTTNTTTYVGLGLLATMILACVVILRKKFN